MMRLIPMLTLLFFASLAACKEASVESALKKYNDGTVPYIEVEELAQNSQYLLLDTREEDEYKISHIPDALWVGYKTFDIKSLGDNIPRDTSIVVYCSVGVRSEDIGEKLLANGFSGVNNLFGGIFEWKNQGNSVLDSAGRTTENVHAYSKFWGHLLTDANRVY